MLTPAILFYDVVLVVHVLAVVLAFGVTFTYPLLDAHRVLFGLVGAVFTPSERRLAQLAARDLQAGGARSAEYEQEAKKLAMFGAMAGVLIIVAIFLMTVKPGA